MPLIFPNNPTIGDQTTGVNNVVYEWDGEKWKSISTADTPTLIASGDTKAQVTDTGSDGQFKVYTENTEQFTISPSGDATLLSQNELRFSDADNSNYVGLKAPTAASGNIVWTLPPADGIAEQVLGTNGSGELYWTAGGGASVVVSSGAPASPDVGDVWFDTDEMRSYVYYDDGTSSQWVEMNPSWNGTVDDGSITPAKLSTGGPSWTASGDFSVDTNTLYVDATNNRVGVGTSAPVAPLVISNGGAEGWELDYTSGTTELIGYNRSTSARTPMKIIGQTFLVQTGNPSLSNGLYQDSSGKVGINDTTPDSLLTVTGGAIRSKNVTGDTGFDFHENGSAALIRQRNNRPLLLYTSNTERVRIDDDGRVTMPYQPYALVYFQSLDVGATNNKVGPGQTKTVPTGIVNNAFGLYSPSGATAGRFTAPVAGLYEFSFSTNMSTSTATNWVALLTTVNGSSVNLWHYEEKNVFNWQYLTFSDKISLNANDWLELHFRCDTGTMGSDVPDTWNRICFRLIR